MANLTEKESKIEHGLTSIHLYAEFRDGQIDKVYALLEIDGNRLGQSPGIVIYDCFLGDTSYYMALVESLQDELAEKLYNEVYQFKGF